MPWRALSASLLTQNPEVSGPLQQTEDDALIETRKQVLTKCVEVNTTLCTFVFCICIDLIVARGVHLCVALASFLV